MSLSEDEQLEYEVLTLMDQGVTNSRQVIETIVARGRFTEERVAEMMAQLAVKGYIDIGGPK